jgi:hypothetical protein
MELKDKSLPEFVRMLRHLVMPSLLVMALFGVWLIAGCSYSFTGAIPSLGKTISISYLPNNSLLVQPTLSRKLTEAIRDKFTNQSNLALVGTNGDLNIEGEITGYTTEPVAITGEQTAALQRLKITVNIRFTNKQDETQNFETSFSRFQDYNSKQRLADVENALIELINEDLAQDIFNKAVDNW